jgi:mono/diheme cytochrome c family protein
MRRPLLVLAVALLVAGCGGGETVEGTVPAEKTPTVGKGDAEAGKKVFTSVAQPTCGSCHTYVAAGTNATVGPDLDVFLCTALTRPARKELCPEKDAAFILESIVNPDAHIASGFTAGVMPKDYGEKLSDKQLADLVAFLLPKG